MRLGIDLGGTKIEIIALNNKVEAVFRQRVDTPQGDYPQTVSAIVDLVEQTKQFLVKHVLIKPLERVTIGMGIPGAISLKTGRVKNANSVCLIGQPLQADLEQQLQQPVRINNDANCLTVSEATDGAAAGCDIVFGVILGTGTGGGIAIHQQAITGINAIAGEWGHNPMPWYSEDDGQIVPCYCGKQNCIETFLSGPGMLQRFIQSGGTATSTQEIITQAGSGNKQAELFMQKYEHWLARGLASVINVLDPDTIVLGGGLSNIDRLYNNVPELWQDYVFSDQVVTRLVKAQYGDSSGVRGAAWLWPAIL
ncbi:MAG: ROK family protein [gamma proteobacterium symbiont of Bathyaustriella thionipta]|nr:ROK family protein [gamma proteobacterium symbiont of Bathyaustriella thionipta]MCU7949572.1 ROK family protein [gamma proteobacterium symbiont of Bathyaustriella thionipta]MCU7952940.1 ROK family protein [gamma proteobacterium symbiont of Bathyaustriella thionipta]MCU7956164.1 ROK family protein [gamma proteobacterium symbiont of Bathyaustriella thionipta]MCU7966690.1 ROK family protein [gamma proteobacterium symbiont of Bathyaustriella thionipta]